MTTGVRLTKVVSVFGLALLIGAVALPYDMTFEATYAEAARRKKKRKRKRNKKIFVDPTVVGSTTVISGTKRKPKEVTVSCYDGKSGQVKQTKKGAVFVPYSQTIKSLRKKARRNRRAKKKLRNIRQLKRKSTESCAAGGDNSGPGGTPSLPTGSPALSLERYEGNFGPAEAHTLFDRFGFSASPARISQAVAEGLDTTVAKLTTFVPDNHLDPLVADMTCDTYLATDRKDDPTACTPGDDNDFSRTGLRMSYYLRTILTSNDYFNRLFFFLHDERMAAGIGILDGDTAYAAKNHVEILRAATITGDYKQFMRNWNSDVLGHLVWLDGASNDGERPNENYAREFWELGTVGPKNLDGSPVYTDDDVAQAALAFSGWRLINEEFSDFTGGQYRKKVAAYSEDLHADGVFTIFRGTPHEARVRNADDVLEATFRHPRTAEHLAEDIWQEFINPFPTAGSIRSLAKLIRDNNYNLHPVMRTVMRSKALYAGESRKSLMKHPIDLVFGTLKTFPQLDVASYNYNDGDPYIRETYWEKIDDVLGALAQRPLDPPSVFGWDTRPLASEAYVLDWRNQLNTIIGANDYTRDVGVNPNSFLIPGATTEQEAVAYLAGALGVSLTAEQNAILVEFMNNELRDCSKRWRRNDDECKAGAPYYLERKRFDVNPDADKKVSEWKVQGLAAILMMMPEYRMK